jgi:toxin secretion/phage lysis holin
MEYRIILTAATSTSAYLLGGFDKAIEALLILSVIDYITGLINAALKGELSSKTGLKGICKKFFIFAIVAMCVQIERFVNQPESVHNVVVWFFVGNEAISIVENVEHYIPLPEWLKKWLKKFRDKGGRLK